MCVAGCYETVRNRLARRGFLSAGGLAVAAAGAAMAPAAAPAQTNRSFGRVIDLTHTLSADFPTYDGASGFTLEQFLFFDQDGYNMARWSLVEQTGTHMDAPIHFSADGETADEIPVDNLVVPLAVVDIRAKAAEDADAQLTVDDLKAWEAANGEIPQGACVAMNSGWDSKTTGPAFATRKPTG